MSSEQLQPLIPLFALLINIIAQMVSFICISRLGLLKSEYLGFALGLLSITLSELYLGAGLTMLITNLIIYAALGFCYFTFVNLGETARRVRILGELADSRDGLTTEEILQRYSAQEVMQKRVERLVNNGQIVFKNGRYFIGNPTMLLIAKTVELVKLLVLGEKQIDTDKA